MMNVIEYVICFNKKNWYVNYWRIVKLNMDFLMIYLLKILYSEYVFDMINFYFMMLFSFVCYIFNGWVYLNKRKYKIKIIMIKWMLDCIILKRE